MDISGTSLITFSQSGTIVGTGTLGVAPFQLLPNISGTVGNWQFQNNLTDISGNGLDFTMSTGTAAYATVQGSVVGFDFNQTRRLIAPSTGLLRFSGEFTATMLIVPRVLNIQTFFNCETAGSTSTAYQLFASGHPHVAYSDNNVSNRMTPFTGLSVQNAMNLWTVRRRSLGGSNYVVEFFANNVLFCSINTTTVTINGNERLYVGGWSGGVNLNAILAGLRIVNYAQTNAEINTDFQNTIVANKSIFFNQSAGIGNYGSILGTNHIVFNQSASGNWLSATNPITFNNTADMHHTGHIGDFDYVPCGCADGGTPPEVVNVYPPVGTNLSPNDTVEFDVIDTDTPFRRILVYAIYPNSQITEMVHTGYSFCPRFILGSTRNPIESGYRFKLKKSTIWPDSEIRIVVAAVNVVGQGT